MAAVAIRVVRAVGGDGSSALFRVDEGQGVGEAPPPGPRRARLPRRVGLDALRDRLGQHEGSEKGDLTGPNPVDRGKYGSKIHLITERTGLPLSVAISGANLHDSQALIPLMKGIPPIRSRRGRRRRKPDKLHADKGYDYSHLRRWLRERGISHRIARKGVETSQRLGRHRWTIERTMAWLAGCRRLHRRYERKAEHFLAFTSIACTLICYRRLTK
jgi:transposase